MRSGKFYQLKIKNLIFKEHKRLFFAGKNTAMNYFFLDQMRISCESYNQEYHQGQIAAYNILGLVFI